MELERKPFQGVLNILDFNRHFYYYGIAALLLLLGIFNYFSLPTLLSVLLIAGFTSVSYTHLTLPTIYSV